MSSMRQSLPHMIMAAIGVGATLTLALTGHITGTEAFGFIGTLVAYSMGGAAGAASAGGSVPASTSSPASAPTSNGATAPATPMNAGS